MRALNFTGEQLVFRSDYPVPRPRAGEALIRVLMAGICNTDLEILRGYQDFRGVPGHEFVGVVEEIPDAETRRTHSHLLGQRIVGDINAACYQSHCDYCQRGMHTHCPRRTTLGIVDRDGAFADYLCLPVENLFLVPEGVSDEEAVFVEPLAANFEMLEQLHLKPTASVLVLGDGKQGQLAARVLALNGCEVCIVGKHPEKLALAAEVGAVPYLLEQSETFQLPEGRRVDAVVECTGNAQGLELALKLVRPRGTLLLKSTVADKSTINLAPIIIDEILVQGSRCGPFAPTLRVLGQKRIDVQPLISACYALEDGLEAFEYAAQKGVLKVLLKVS
ncbi:MDR/zinc-dependent alcohol dehydrogenase-like family protein [Tengunoibacter tsumagoiensis]|uniref:Alcohol dehydrogenase n=1 Tax=Tengunoibacter tsumagoiensis TaxID=2014871 RepID=A0A402A4M2_9CHLR|nr:alcohol dehydrogenase catalytic domain-containing protein [Tengunoibacter tsumagoiensis]GCE14093.1 alcohol dehydrogenase [Tengunoibacter tsumagoiensis]